MSGGGRPPDTFADSILPSHMQMRVLFADGLPPACIDGVRAVGYECSVQPNLSAEDLPGAIGGFDVLVVRSTEVTAATIEAADALGLVVRAGAGTNTIAVEAAADSGVQVANVPGENAIAVAELTMGLLLAVDRRIADAVIDSRAGKWDKEAYSKGRGLYGRTIGVVGLGAIGMAVAERARGFGMRVVAVAKPDREAELLERMDALGMELVGSMSDLMRVSDVVTFHVPSSGDTKNLIGSALLAELKPGAVIINTSRGDTIDEEALLAAIEEKGLWVGLDVFADEPESGHASFESALARHPRVYGTHHIGASTQQAQEAIGEKVVAILELYKVGEDLPNVVNLIEKSGGGATLMIRHKNRVGVLSAALAILRSAGLNIENMANRIFIGSDAALATIHVGSEIDDDLANKLREIDHVMAITIS